MGHLVQVWLLDPYQSAFMQRAAIAAVLLGVLAPTVGVWIVLRRLSYLGDAMSHGTLGGVAVAYLTGLPIVVGALVAGLTMGWLVTSFEGRRRLGADAVIGVSETLLFALGVLVITSTDRIGVDITHFLFGQILTITAADLVLTAGLTAAALITVAVAFDDLRAVTFDPVHAAQVGIPVTALRYVLMALVSVTVVVSLDIVGLLLSVAMLVTPAATARLVTNRVPTMTLTAIGVGVSSCLGGLTLSYHLAVPPGPAIALLTVVWFTAAALVGWAPARARRHRCPGEGDPAPVRFRAGAAFPSRARRAGVPQSSHPGPSAR